jgi:hypothetical protein
MVVVLVVRIVVRQGIRRIALITNHLVIIMMVGSHPQKRPQIQTIIKTMTAMEVTKERRRTVQSSRVISHIGVSMFPI